MIRDKLIAQLTIREELIAQLTVEERWYIYLEEEKKQVIDDIKSYLNLDMLDDDELTEQDKELIEYCYEEYEGELDNDMGGLDFILSNIVYDAVSELSEEDRARYKYSY